MHALADHVIRRRINAPHQVKDTVAFGIGEVTANQRSIGTIAPAEKLLGQVEREKLALAAVHECLGVRELREGSWRSR